MSFFMLIFGATALAVGTIQLATHLGGSKYVFGNAKLFGIGVEGYTLWTTLITAGTISGFLINTFAGLIIWGILELGAYMYGGTKIKWSYSRIKHNFGFYTEEVSGKYSGVTFTEMVVDVCSTVISSVWEFIKQMFSKLSPSEDII